MRVLIKKKEKPVQEISDTPFDTLEPEVMKMNRNNVTQNEEKTGKGVDERNPKQKLVDDKQISHEIQPSNNQNVILLYKIGIYFSNFFPFEEIHRWLNYGGRGRFEYREFASTLVVGETVIRNISFRNCHAMIRSFLADLPIKIDIGARFHTDPQDTSPTIILKFAERELVIDIDLSDYNNVRTCCSEDDICRKCWKYAAFACKILDASFREDFGWKHILWVFSGRRGIHAWVCDQEARVLSNRQRQGIVDFYTLSSGNTFKRPELRSRHLHLHIRRSFEIAFPTFVPTCVIEQNILGTDKGVEIFLTLIPAGSLRENVKRLMLSQSTSISRWDNFVAYWESQKEECSEECKERPHLIVEIVLFYTYPRLDSAVTTDTRHLLKAPFSLHPKTQKVCLPIDPTKVDEFDINNVPSLDDLVDSITTQEMLLSLVEYDTISIVDNKYMGNDKNVSVNVSEKRRDKNQTSIFEMLEDKEILDEGWGLRVTENDAFQKIFGNVTTWAKVRFKLLMQKRKYDVSVKFFSDFVNKMDESPD